MVGVISLVNEFSPHTRGWPGSHARSGNPRRVLPAHAGMARRWGRPWPSGAEFSPHTRGWPVERGSPIGRKRRSPRTRGDGPSSTRPSSALARVLPAHAGMARAATVIRSPTSTFSPHTRGWPGRSMREALDAVRSPRTRGDGPSDFHGIKAKRAGSPRTRGDGPDFFAFFPETVTVLPAHAGMARAER